MLWYNTPMSDIGWNSVTVGEDEKPQVSVEDLREMMADLDPEDFDESVQMFLEELAQTNDVSELKQAATLLLQDEVDFAPEMAEQGIEPDEGFIALLIAAGADVNVADAEGYTPLMRVRGENAELIRFLLAAGADVNARNDGGNVLDHILFRSKEVECLLMEAGARYCVDDMNDVESAVEYPDTRWLRLLLDDGLDVNCVNETGQTPLMLAAWKGHTEALSLLLEAGAAATIDRRDAEEGVTALHAAVIACRSKSTTCPKNVELLLAAGADVNLADRDGWTPLHSCAYYNLPQLVPLLLRAGAAPSRVEHRGLTPAEMAREKGHEAVARLLH